MPTPFLRRPVLALLVLAVSAGSSLTGCKSAQPSPGGKQQLASKVWRITVGPDPCDLKEGGKPCPTQAISKNGLDRIVWTPNAGQTLEIIVHVPAGCPVPFKHMTPAGTNLWAVECNNNQCNSGPAENNACEQDYKYDQILGGQKCDGMIIIRP